MRAGLNCKICGQFFSPACGNHTLCSDKCREVQKKRHNRGLRRPMGRKLMDSEQGPFESGRLPGESWQIRWARGAGTCRSI